VDRHLPSVSAAETQTANAYGALKATQILFAKGRAEQKAKLHVRVTVVSPGTVYFEGGVWHRVEQGMPELFRITMAPGATGRMATPLEIANAALAHGLPTRFSGSCRRRVRPRGSGGRQCSVMRTCA